MTPMIINLNRTVIESGGIADYNEAMFAALERVGGAKKLKRQVCYADIGVGNVIPFFAAVKMTSKGNPVFITVHDGPWINPYIFSGMGVRSRILQSLSNRILGRQLNKYLLRKATGLIVLLDQTKKRLVSLSVAESRILQIPHIAFYTVGAELSFTSRVVLYVLGVVRHDKRIETTLHVAENLKTRGIAVEVRFVGLVRDAVLMQAYRARLESARIPFSCVTPKTVYDFKNELLAPGFAIFDYSRNTISGSGSLIHALSSGVYCLVRSGSVLSPCVPVGEGEEFASVEDASLRIAMRVEDGINTPQAVIKRRQEAGERLAADRIAGKLLNFIIERV